MPYLAFHILLTKSWKTPWLPTPNVESLLGKNRLCSFSHVCSLSVQEKWLSAAVIDPEINAYTYKALEEINIGNSSLHYCCYNIQYVKCIQYSVHCRHNIIHQIFLAQCKNKWSILLNMPTHYTLKYPTYVSSFCFLHFDVENVHIIALMTFLS